MNIPFDDPVSIGGPTIDLSAELAVAILEVIQDGWSTVLDEHGVSHSDDEVAITERLRTGMRRTVNSGRLPYTAGMIVAPGAESMSVPNLRRPDGRTDIPVFLIEIRLSSGDHDPHVIIECKIVAEADAALGRAYVVQGIDRFKSGKYGARHRVGFMTGYVRAGSAEGSVESINRYLRKARRGDELLEPDIRLKRGLNWSSTHRRAASSILLHHAMVAFPTVSAP